MALVSPVEAPAHVSDAIRKASAATGVNFQYLLTTAARESNFKPQAKARTSSAAGLFQFIESTWLQTLKEEGARYGLGKFSPHIFKTSSGRYYVPDRQVRQEILALRHNPEAASLMAGAFTQQNAEYVEDRLGRKPTQGELYIAHFLGRGGATRLISLASENPNARADAYFPKAAGANRGIFYSSGRPRSLSQVYDLLVSDHSRLEALTVAAAEKAQAVNPAQNSTAATPAPSPVANSDTNDTGLATDSLAALFGEGRPAGIVAKTRVAALTNPITGDAIQTMSDTGLGSIGPWHTIIEHEQTGRTNAAAVAPPLPDRKPEAAPVKRPPLIAQQTRRPAPQASQPVAKATDRSVANVSASAARAARAQSGIFSSNYWMNSSLSGS